MIETRKPRIVAVFENREQAQRAYDDLKNAGFPEDLIGMAGSLQETTEVTGERGKTDLKHAGDGAGLGVLAGACVTGMASGSLAGAVPGAVIGGLIGVFLGMGIPREKAEAFEREINEGRTIVTVQAKERHDEAVVILEQQGASFREPEITNAL